MQYPRQYRPSSERSAACFAANWRTPAGRVLVNMALRKNDLLALCQTLDDLRSGAVADTGRDRNTALPRFTGRIRNLRLGRLALGIQHCALRYCEDAFAFLQNDLRICGHERPQ